MKYSGIGGQAVLEGIMMKNKDNYATAVRKPDGEIVVKKDTYVSMTEKVKFFSLPFVRGIFSFADSMILGMRSLTWSASFFEDDEEDEEPGKFEKFLIDTFGEKVDKVVMSAVMVFSVFMAIAIFMVLPLLIAGIFRKFVHSETVMAVLEGCIRIGIFITYIKVISRMDDIKRTFMYHGSEHKCINCLEHGLVLNVENVRKSSKEHKRCGTSFLLIVMGGERQKEFQGAQALRNKFSSDCYGDQYSVLHGDPRGHDLAADHQQNRPDPGDRGCLL